MAGTAFATYKGLYIITGAMTSGKCEAKGTLIALHDGTKKKIEDIQLGDRLQALDGYNTCISISTGISKEMYKVTTSFDYEYKVTPNHRLSVLSVADANKILLLADKDNFDSLQNLRDIKSYIIDIPARDINPFLYRGIRYSRWGFIPYEFRIEKVEGDCEWIGLTLDGDQRYIHNSGVVTHNSSELQRRARALSKIGKVMIFNSSLDTRKEGSTVATHDGITMAAVKVARLMDIFPDKKGISISDTENLTYKIFQDYTDSQYIFVDEAQFFPDILEFVKKSLSFKKTIIIAGLDSKSDGKNFLPFNELLPLCTEIVKLHAYCVDCKNGTPATATRCLIKQNGILVGGTDIYEAVCADHFNV